MKLVDSVFNIFLTVVSIHDASYALRLITKTNLVMFSEFGDVGTVFLVNEEKTVFDFDAAFSARIIWGFFGRPRNSTFNMLYIVGFTLCFNDPHGNGRIG